MPVPASNYLPRKHFKLPTAKRLGHNEHFTTETTKMFTSSSIINSPLGLSLLEEYSIFFSACTYRPVRARTIWVTLKINSDWEADDKC